MSDQLDLARGINAFVKREGLNKLAAQLHRAVVPMEDAIADLARAVEEQAATIATLRAALREACDVALQLAHERAGGVGNWREADRRIAELRKLAEDEA